MLLEFGPHLSGNPALDAGGTPISFAVTSN
jgi:hypothetical protein